jgi:hypothetical protein
MTMLNKQQKRTVAEMYHNRARALVSEVKMPNSAVILLGELVGELEVWAEDA